MIKKIYIIAGLLALCFTSSCQAFLSGDKTEIQTYRLSNVFLKLSQQEDIKSIYTYDTLITKLESGVNTLESTKDREVIHTVIDKLELRKASLASSKNRVSRHKSLILKFWAGAQSTDALESKRSELESIESVFIFRNGSIDFPGYQVEAITKKLKEINPDILIFIDQEGGLINRYVEFDSKISFQNYLSTDSYVSDIYNGFSDTTKTALGGVFPTGYQYFPSLTRIGETYVGLIEDDKQDYLDLVAYLRLKTLSDRGANTYGLVMDLDRGNPVISGYRRSFSSDLESYKKLGQAFLSASQKTGVSLYLKHFPGHGAGQVDSHKGILDYTSDANYVSENLELFNYMLENKKYAQIGVMVGHMYVPNTLKSEFTSILDNADYILTDDLAMSGYTLATGGEKSGVFFTTDVVFASEKAILVDSLVNPNIK